MATNPPSRSRNPAAQHRDWIIAGSAGKAPARPDPYSEGIDGAANPEEAVAVEPSKPS